MPPPIPPATRSTTTVVRSTPRRRRRVQGVTIASTASGDRLYATDFHGGTVEVFDGSLAPVTTAGGFLDPSLPAGLRALRHPGDRRHDLRHLRAQDAGGHDDVAGKHHGFVNAFTPDGVLLRRVASGGKLDSPWGLAMAPAEGFGRFGGKLLVGNFGDGHIVGYTIGGADASEDGGAYLAGQGGRITIDGLWGIGFGNGAAAGPTTRSSSPRVRTTRATASSAASTSSTGTTDGRFCLSQLTRSRHERPSEAPLVTRSRRRALRP